ncbi:MAG: hypothetical protein WC959_00340 [Kiritimatiellales bacterium]
MNKLFVLLLQIFICIVPGFCVEVININFDDQKNDINDIPKLDYARKAKWDGSLAGKNSLGIMIGSSSAKYRFTVKPGVLYATGGVDFGSNKNRGIYFANLDMTAGGANETKIVRVSWSFDIVGASSSANFTGRDWVVEINSTNKIEAYDLMDHGGDGYKVVQKFNVENAGKMLANLNKVKWTTVTGHYDIAVGKGSALGMIKVRPNSLKYIESGAGAFAIDNIVVDISPK